MNSVEPSASAASTTASVHSGCTTTWQPGCCARARSICSTLKRTCTEQCPCQSRMRLAVICSASSPPIGRAGFQSAISVRGSMPSRLPVLRPRCWSGKKSTRSPRSKAQRRTAGAFRRRADGAAVAAHERLQRGRRVHVRDGDRALGVDHGREFVPGGVDVLGLGHVGHRAAGREVGQHHGLVGPGEDVGALGHEVHAAEQDVVGLGPVGGLAGQLERVAADVREADHVVALIVGGPG